MEETAAALRRQRRTPSYGSLRPKIGSLDSHSGIVVRRRLFDSEGKVRLDILSKDFRETGGMTLPYGVEYLGPDGALLAAEIFETITVFEG